MLVPTGYVGRIGQGFIRKAGATFLPTQLTDLILWLDASDTASITSAAGLVSAWNDKSGNNYHATQITDANKPSTGTRTVNGRNVLDFDGSTSFLTHSTGYRGLMSAGASYTIISIFATDVTTGTHSIFSMQTGGSPVLVQLQVNDTFAASSMSVVSTSNTSPRMGVYSRSGTTRQLIRDGARAIDANGVDLTLNNAVYTGRTLSSNYLNGVMMEQFIYLRALTDAEINLIGAYASYKWGVAWSNL